MDAAKSNVYMTHALYRRTMKFSNQRGNSGQDLGGL